eukprot:Gb_23969 [translate_table: standard]
MAEMKKGTSPLRIPPRNSPKKFFPDSNNSSADGNPFHESNVKDHSFSNLRPPLCPIPEANYNLPASMCTEQDPSTPRGKCDAVTPLPRTKLFTLGQGQVLNQFSENICKGSNFSTPENDLLGISMGLSNTKNRFGWHESKAQSSSATEMDFAHFSAGLVKYPSHGNIQEMNLLLDPPLVSIVAGSENMSLGTPNGVARSLKYNQPVTASTGSLPMVPFTEIQNVAPVKALQSDSKNIFVQHHFELQEDPSFWDDHNVQVVIRIRPLSSIEIASQGHSRCVKQDTSHTITWMGHPETRFTFDLVAGEKITQEKLFKVAGLPMVENCMGGYNSCMFAYGQTGSGKTHTMLGDIEDADHKPSANRGMTPRVFEYLFTRIRKEEEARREDNLKFVCKCSFLEIYNEQIADLLEPSSANLQMREDAKKGVYVENLLELEVKSVHDVIRLLLQGSANRKVAATNMNRASSRSHSVFTCVIESKWESQSVTHHRFGRLNLVDLAGSERQKSSGAEGERLKEATNINKSLSTLGLVIMNLVNTANGKPQHVPYRDSKLTFLLQDSLGGNSKTTIIANVSPSNCCAMETLSTLKFAQRAKYIRNNATINEDATGDVITLRMQIQQLKEEVNRLRGQLKGGLSEPTQEDDYGNMSLLSSPGSCMWDSVKALASPLLTNKKAPRKRDLESALAGALKREQSTDMAMKAMDAENQQLKRLVKQREEDAQCAKMMLRFREDKIKRLEAVASGKMSTEAHLLEERNVLMEELQILRNRLERNPEVTRFAMENIRLMEQLRRFQEFYEGGEREQMSEQIAVLRDQLLEALDWKLMHEQDPNLAIQKESSEGELSFTSEENELLHRQVDQYRREAEALRNNLSFCLEAKEKLERRVDDLMIQIDKMKTSNADRAIGLNTVMEAAESQEDETFKESLLAQRELKDLVEAISAASQREAEAQGAAISLAREVEDLRKKLKESVEDNRRLIDMYEKAMQERDAIRKTEKETRDLQVKAQEQVILLRNQVEELEKEITERNMVDMYAKVDCMKTLHETSNGVNGEAEHDILHLRKEVEELQSKLQDTSEENERLLELYERAMRERDDIRRMWWNCREKSVSGEHRTGREDGTHASLGDLQTLIEGHAIVIEDNCEFRVSQQGVSHECAIINGDGEAETEVIRLRKEVEEFEIKLKDILEENERLIEMYEKAMQEKDEIKKMWQDSAEMRTFAELKGSIKWHTEGAEELRKEAEQLQIEFQEKAEENNKLADLQNVCVLDCIRASQHSNVEDSGIVGQAKPYIGNTRSESDMASQNDFEHLQMQLNKEEKNMMVDEGHSLTNMLTEHTAEADQHVMLLENEVEDLQIKLRNAAPEGDRQVEHYKEPIQRKDQMLLSTIVSRKTSDELRVEAEYEEEYQKLGPNVEQPQAESTGTADTECLQHMEPSIASADAFIMYTTAVPEHAMEVQQHDTIHEIQNLHIELGKMAQENGKLIQMYEKATHERNELVKLWQKATDALKHAEKMDLFKESGSHNIDSEEIGGLEQKKMQAEAKNIWISERNQELFLIHREDAGDSPEQANFGKNMDENLESDSIFSILTKEVDELQSKMKEMAEEYVKLAIMYEETANEKDKIRKALQKTAQELENSTKERTCFSREIEDLRSRLKDIMGGNHEMVKMNERDVKDLGTWQVAKAQTEDYAKNADVYFGPQDEGTDLEAKQMKGVEPMLTENQTDTGMESAIEEIAVHNNGNLDAQVPDLHAWNLEKCKELQEREQRVQQKFEEMDVKLGHVGASMDDLDVLKDKLENDLEIIRGQATELVSSITVKDRKLQDMQLELECLEMKLRESEQSKESICFLSSAERSKWAEQEAELQRDKDLMVEHMVNWEKLLFQELVLAKSKLVFAQDRLAEVTRMVDSLSLIEKSHKEMNKLGKESESLQLQISQKKQEIDSLQTCASQVHEKKICALNKLSALKKLISDFSASEEYWKCRESRANVKVGTFSCLIKEKMKEMDNLQDEKKALEAAIKQTLEVQVTAQAKVCDLKEKLQRAEQQRVDAEKTVVQLDKQTASCSDLRSSLEQISTQFGKAASLLKCEEERMELFTALKECSDLVKDVRAKIEKLEAKSKLVDSSIHKVQLDIEAGTAALKEAELALQRTLNEKQMLIDSQEEGRKENDILILELQFLEFEVQSKGEELKISRKDLQELINKLAEVEDLKHAGEEKSKQELELENCLLSQLLQANLKDVQASVWEAEVSLDSLQSKRNEVSKGLDG